MPGLYQPYPGVPFPTGGEQLLADLSTPNSNTNGLLSALQLAGAGPTFRNSLIGGDFSTNPWQRGTSFSSISNTLTYTADRFFALGGASSSISVSQQALSAGDISINGNRFTHALQFGRAAANADTTTIKLGQALESLDSIPLQGRTVVLSFWAKKGTNYSALASMLSLLVATGTGTDETAANLAAGAWTGYAAAQLYTAASQQIPVGANAGGNPNSSLAMSTVLTPVNGVVLTTAWERYQVTCTLPAAATQVGVVFSYAPVGTAGAADYIQIVGVQLEPADSDLPFASTFEHLPPGDVLDRCLRYAYRLNEKATVAAVQANGMISATNVETVCIQLPKKMRTTPTVTVSAGTFRFNIAGSLTAVGGGFAAGAAATQSPEAINVVGAVTATVGQGTQLVSGAATWGGYVQASAEL